MIHKCRKHPPVDQTKRLRDFRQAIFQGRIKFLTIFPAELTNNSSKGTWTFLKILNQNADLEKKLPNSK